MSGAARIYLDACCLNRPFDDQSQDRIRLESEATVLILNRAERKELDWISSSVLVYELRKTPDAERRERVEAILEFASAVVVAEAESIDRAEQLHSMGFKAVDALHVACAEQASCEVLLTTDDRFLRAARRHAGVLRVRIENPVTWLQEGHEP